MADERRVAGEVAVELNERFDFGGKPALRVIGGGGGDVTDELVGLLLDAVTPSVDVRRAHEQEERQAHEGQHENSQ